MSSSPLFGLRKTKRTGSVTVRNVIHDTSVESHAFVGGVKYLRTSSWRGNLVLIFSVGTGDTHFYVQLTGPLPPSSPTAPFPGTLYFFVKEPHPNFKVYIVSVQSRGRRTGRRLKGTTVSSTPTKWPRPIPGDVTVLLQERAKPTYRTSV